MKELAPLYKNFSSQKAKRIELKAIKAFEEDKSGKKEEDVVPKVLSTVKADGSETATAQSISSTVVHKTNEKEVAFKDIEQPFVLGSSVTDKELQNHIKSKQTESDIKNLKSKVTSLKKAEIDGKLQDIENRKVAREKA